MGGPGRLAPRASAPCRRVAAGVLLAAAAACVFLAVGVGEAGGIDAAGSAGVDGAAGGAIGAGATGSGGGPVASVRVGAGELGARLGELLLTCALTAVVEELVFRGLLLGAVAGVARRFVGGRRAVLIAVGVSTAVFAVLHVVPDAAALLGGEAGAASSGVGDTLGAASRIGEAGPVGADVGIVSASLGLKLAQALLFGTCMAALLLMSRGLVVPIAVHAGFDALYFAPAVLMMGGFPSTYICASAAEWAALAASCVVLLWPAAASARWLACRVVPYGANEPSGDPR
ncbi:MAG: CPBP family intramembrane metalloprotease [Eggerthellaceae bacterium]|nr:CPBP family intramembrane metalloprotease [Eggerthellaceae bacterium]